LVETEVEELNRIHVSFDFKYKTQKLLKYRYVIIFSYYRDNVSEWGDMSIRGLLFQRASTINI
jgi:hypothetical protein